MITKFFPSKKHWIISLCILTILSATGCSSGQASQNDQPANAAQTQASKSETPKLDKTPTYSTGTYLVNKDIPSGLYRATLDKSAMGMGYVERAKDLKMELDSIIANIILQGDGYVTIKDTDAAVKLQGVTLSSVDLTSLTPNIKKEVPSGIFLVGYDISPGTYKVEVTDTITKMGYVERMSDASMDMDAIIANEIFQGPGYVEIVDTDFAIKVQGAKLVLQ